MSWYWSEFLRFRASYEHRGGDRPSEDAFWLQVTWIFGADVGVGQHQSVWTDDEAGAAPLVIAAALALAAAFRHLNIDDTRPDAFGDTRHRQ